MKKKNLFMWAICLYGWVAAVVLMCGLIRKEKEVSALKSAPNMLITAYEMYYFDVETLLDSINAKDDSFLDTTGETDTYFDYCQSRKRVNDLYIVK